MKKGKQFKRLWGLMLLLIAMLMPQGAWAANHYDAGYESTATTYSAAGIKFKITAVRMYNYQGNNSHFNSNPVVTITAGGHTHTFNLGSLTGESGNSIFYYNGEGNENPYKGSGSFSKRTYEQTVDGIPVKAYFDNQKNEQRVSTNPDKTYKDNGDGSSKWCTADLTIEIGVQTAATVTINGNWRDESDGINKTESYSWPFDIPKHTCNSDIQSATNTYLKSAATCTDAAVYYESCSWCGAAQSGTFTSGSALGHGTTGYTESYSWTGNAYNDASKDTKACIFTLTCKKCSTKVVNGASLTCIKTAHVDATCRATGSTTYQATGSYTAANSAYNYSATKTNVYTVAALGHGTTGYTESYSWTGNAYNDASKDTKACIFTLTCKNCSTKVVNGASLTCIKMAHVDATCTATGSTTYQATGSYTAANSAYNYSATKTNVYTVAALGHGTTGYTESYSWTGNAYNDASQDTKACTFTLTCKKCSTKVVNGASLTCTKTAHVDALCTATGSTTYQATGSYTAANSAYNYSATKTNVYTIAALGHSYGAGSWSWEDDGHSATCTRTCSHDANHTSSKSVTLGNGITSELTEAATCSKKGSHTYTATTTVENVEYSDSKEVADIDIDPLNHNYGAGVWSWNNDGHSATCTRTCSYDANHTSSASVTLGNGIESVKLSDPTCGVQGTTRYTAMTTVEGAQYSDTKDVDDIAATGLHTFDDVTDPHHTLCTVCKHSFFRYTSSTEDVVNPNNVNELKGANGAKLDFTNTYVDGKGVMEFKGTLKTIGNSAFSRCTGFTGNLTIPNSVTSIGKSAFLKCSGFTGNLTIPNSVTSIGDYAFEKCSGFTGNLTIPNSVTSIGYQAFDECSGFTGNLTIPNSVTCIREWAFYECYGFNGNLTIPNSVTSIGEYTFSGCRGFIGDLTIPNSVTSIEKSAFEGCSGFNGNLTIANSVTSIGDYAFSGCEGFTGVELNSVPQIGSSTFNQVNCSKTVILSDNSNVYTGSNPYFPTVASVKAPCTLDLTGSVVENHANLTRTHNYTNNTLTASPIEDGLYAYACDNGCGTHTDDHIIKDFNGAGNHLELTKDGEGNYSTSEDIIINDPASFYSSVDFSSPVDFSAPSVTFNRYIINDGGMWSFIVPFDIPAAQAAQLGTFYQYSKHEEGKVYFDDITKIDNADGIVRANTAYFFKPATDFTSITVDDAEIKATTSMPDATNPSEPGLYGTYSQIDIPVGAYGYAMHWGESTFVKAGTGNLLRSFRAYLWLGSGASMAKALAFFGDYDDITGINNIETDTDLDMSKPIYTLSGQRIMTPKKGEIYIQNGKKVIKK